MSDVFAPQWNLPSGKTRFLLLFGNRLAQSPSPAFHTEGLTRAGFDAVMLPAELDEAGAFRSLLASLLPLRGFLGGNITVPFKAAALKVPGLRHEPEAARLGAANTLFRSAAGWSLGNTDFAAFASSLEALLMRVQASGWDVHILGAGGAASVAAEVCRSRASVRSVHVWTRDWSRADAERSYWRAREASPGLLPYSRGSLEEVAAGIAGTAGAATRTEVATRPGEGAGSATLLVNTLPLGYGGEENPAAASALRAIAARGCPAAFYDVLYERTPALLLAEGLGIPAVDGRRMWELQAGDSQRLWREALEAGH